MNDKRLQHRIVHVEEGSPASRAGIIEGDLLLSVDGQDIVDVFDYRMAVASADPVLEIERGNSGAALKVTMIKDEYEDPGLEFENPLMDEVRRCRNKCVFCFIDQLPKGMRKAVYFKDDDFRLSFLEGNYISLTNLTEQDSDRIIRHHLSPMNISVHTTNVELRRKMIGNPKAGDVLKSIARFVGNGITVNCQIVLCRGWNDGAELKRTLGDLTALCPGVHSISIVPVGLTAHRGGLANLIPFDRETSAAVLAEAGIWQRKMRGQVGSAVVFPADEFYIMSETPIPDNNFYEDYSQLENGVGMTALFMHEFRKELRKAGRCILRDKRKVSLATGKLSFPNMRRMADDLVRIFPDLLSIDVHAIENRFFGPGVTISGLITGGDIAAQLSGLDLGDELLIPGNMTRMGDETFLDDMTVKLLSERLGCKVTPVRNTGKAFIKAVLGVE